MGLTASASEFPAVDAEPSQRLNWASHSANFTVLSAPPLHPIARNLNRSETPVTYTSSKTRTVAQSNPSFHRSHCAPATLSRRNHLDSQRAHILDLCPHFLSYRHRSYPDRCSGNQISAANGQSEWRRSISAAGFHIMYETLRTGEAHLYMQRDVSLLGQWPESQGTNVQNP